VITAGGISSYGNIQEWFVKPQSDIESQLRQEHYIQFIICCGHNINQFVHTGDLLDTQV
jgi:hypothetical protein